MRVFVTGASGFVGSAVTRALIAAGHEVIGLARSENSAAAIKSAGATALRGELADLESLKSGAENADAVMHLGFIHDFANYAAAAETDKVAIEAIGQVLAGTDRPFLVTSGTALLGQGRLLTEEDVAPTPPPGSGARLSEHMGLGLVHKGVGAMVMRLPPSVHGDHDHGFVATLIDIARAKGVSGYVEAGENRWPAVHVSDAASAYVLALEKGKAGARYHPIGDEGIPFRDIATVIGRKLSVPAVSVPRDKAMDHFGWMGRFAQLDVPASSRLTQERLGWMPRGKSLLDDLEQGTYFKE